MERRDFILGATALGGASALISPALLASGSTIASAGRGALESLLSACNELQREYLDTPWRIQTADDVAEGERLLLHILNAGINFWLEADPERPVFTPYVTPARKLLGDNPDALYFFAPVRPDRRYRIRGNLAGATFTSFTVEGGSAEGAAASRSISAIDDSSFEADADGNYEITVSAERPAAGNWLPLGEGAGQITTRHYFESRNCIVNQTGFQLPLAIEALDPAPLAGPPGDGGIASRIGAVERFVRGMMLMSIAGGAGKGPRPPWFSVVPNTFNAPGQWNSESGYGNMHAHYCAAPFVLRPDQALVIEGELPQCRFANVMLWNRFMQTLDYTRRQISLNRSQMSFLPDGRYRVVVAGSDPGVPGWIDSEGRASGLVYWRFLLARGPVPTPVARVVGIGDLQ
jgi:hypothetical protein